MARTSSRLLHTIPHPPHNPSPETFAVGRIFPTLLKRKPIPKTVFSGPLSVVLALSADVLRKIRRSGGRYVTGRGEDNEE